MIRKLKIKFVALAMTVIFILLAIVMTGMNLLNYNSVIQSADTILGILSQNNGSFPDIVGIFGSHMSIYLTPETPYTSRYFSVFLNKSGIVISTDTKNIASVDAMTAIEYAKTALESSDISGFINTYRYNVSTERNGLRIIFLDCASELESFKMFLYTSIIMALLGLVIVFFVIFFLSGRIIKPIAESHEKQKRFITDAGHEIKTPLTIISANADILEMEVGEDNECLVDIQNQTKRLRTLTEDLVMLTRMEEAENKLTKIEFPISDVVSEAVHPFYTLATNQGKTLECSIQPMLTIKGDAKSIGQLVSIFMDNALKYSPVASTVTLNLSKQNRAVCLLCSNATETEINKEQLDHVFERFYRTDSSRNSQTGGHGIGLSVAKAIVVSHGGKIHAETQDGHSFEVIASFPS